MKSKYSLVILSILFCSCGNISNSSNSIINSSSTFSSIDSLNHRGTIWDVSNVDISHIDKSNRLICFTFDDGPNKNSSEELLNVFDSYNRRHPDCIAHGTFFYIGSHINEETKPIIEHAINSGFQIGNHTLNHQRLSELSKEDILNQVNGTLENLKSLGYSLEKAVIRPPYGTVNELVLENVNYPMINWTTIPDLDTKDWEGKSSEDIIYQVNKNAKDGAIVLMHEGYQSSLNATKALLPQLYESGYQVVTIDEYVKARNIKIYTNEVYSHFEY